MVAFSTLLDKHAFQVPLDTRSCSIFIRLIVEVLTTQKKLLLSKQPSNLNQNRKLDFRLCTVVLPSMYTYVNTTMQLNPCPFFTWIASTAWLQPSILFGTPPATPMKVNGYRSEIRIEKE